MIIKKRFLFLLVCLVSLVPFVVYADNGMAADIIGLSKCFDSCIINPDTTIEGCCEPECALPCLQRICENALGDYYTDFCHQLNAGELYTYLAEAIAEGFGFVNQWEKKYNDNLWLESPEKNELLDILDKNISDSLKSEINYVSQFDKNPIQFVISVDKNDSKKPFTLIPLTKSEYANFEYWHSSVRDQYADEITNNIYSDEIVEKYMQYWPIHDQFPANIANHLSEEDCEYIADAIDFGLFSPLKWQSETMYEIYTRVR